MKAQTVPDSRGTEPGHDVESVSITTRVGITRHSLLSSPRRRGPITPSASVVRDRATFPRCGVWVPACAGTTIGKASIHQPEYFALPAAGVKPLLHGERHRRRHRDGRAVLVERHHDRARMQVQRRAADARRAFFAQAA